MCVHEISPCGWCPEPSSTEGNGTSLKAAMAVVDRTAIARAEEQIPARIVPTPSTDALVYHFNDLTCGRIPRVDYPHWDVTTEPEPVPYQHMVKHYVRDVYGEITFAGMVPNPC